MARDPERRRISREAQNARRKLQRRVARFRKIAKSEKNPVFKKVYQREAKNLEAAIKRSAFKRGDTLKQVSEKLSRLQGWVARPSFQKNRNVFVMNEMRKALDGQSSIFGGGKAGRFKIKSFLMATQNDWVAKEGDNLENILQAHPDSDLFEVYESAIGSRKNGKTYAEFIADMLGINYEGVDTSSEAFENMVFENVLSNNLGGGTDLQAALANQYSVLR